MAEHPDRGYAAGRHKIKTKCTSLMVPVVAAWLASNCRKAFIASDFGALLLYSGSEAKLEKQM